MENTEPRFTYAQATEIRELVWRIKDLSDNLFLYHQHGGTEAMRQDPDRGLTGNVLAEAAGLASLVTDLGHVLDGLCGDLGITSAGETGHGDGYNLDASLAQWLCGQCNEHGPCPDCQLLALEANPPFPMPTERHLRLAP